MAMLLIMCSFLGVWMSRIDQTELIHDRMKHGRDHIIMIVDLTTENHVDLNKNDENKE